MGKRKGERRLRRMKKVDEKGPQPKKRLAKKRLGNNWHEIIPRGGGGGKLMKKKTVSIEK